MKAGKIIAPTALPGQYVIYVFNRPQRPATFSLLLAFERAYRGALSNQREDRAKLSAGTYLRDHVGWRCSRC